MMHDWTVTVSRENRTTARVFDIKIYPSVTRRTICNTRVNRCSMQSKEIPVIRQG
jgi:hypothetical protein